MFHARVVDPATASEVDDAEKKASVRNITDNREDTGAKQSVEPLVSLIIVALGLNYLSVYVYLFIVLAFSAPNSCVQLL